MHVKTYVTRMYIRMHTHTIQQTHQYIRKWAHIDTVPVYMYFVSCYTIGIVVISIIRVAIIIIISIMTVIMVMVGHQWGWCCSHHD